MISGVSASGKGMQCEFIAANFALNRPLHLSPPPFNTTTFIKAMNEEEEDAPLEDLRIRRNHLARERHVARFEEQRAADANRRAIHRATCSDAQIAADASWRATQRAVCSNAQNAMNVS
jgi:adenylate kinase family enzyme